MELPKVPFFFRIYSHNGQGIIYKAIKQLDAETYDCEGTRQGGVVDDKIVWVMGGYTDVMPAASIYSILELEKVGKRETTTIINENHLDPALKQMTLYQDGAGYLFGSATLTQRTRSKSKNKNASKSKSKKNWWE